jgi:cytochrome P450
MLKLPELSEAETRSTALVFLLAGYDTTAKLMSNVLVALSLFVRGPRSRLSRHQDALGVLAFR